MPTMDKKQTIITLHGVIDIHNTKAKTSDSKKVIAFINDKNSVRLTTSTEGVVTMRTNVAEYTLIKHATKNMYIGVIDTVTDIKVHFTHKAIVGKLIYWS
jgi:carbonic anhydrase